jgi:D-glycero-alpha-D-manno-heptose-7-phosphate kinase
MNEQHKHKSLKTILARTPIRVNDIGGWTDTWFAGEGKVLNTAVSPIIEVKIEAYENREGRPDRVKVHALNYDTVFRVDPDKPSFEPQPLIQGALNMLPIPEEFALDISIRSEVPAGCSTGTSGSLCVALLGAIDLLQSKRRTPREIASLAHEVETRKLKLQSGIQDQLCAAHGGISYIHMKEYPEADVETLALDANLLRALDERLALIYLGGAHSSSALHEQVIAFLEEQGSQYSILADLRALADEARSSLLEGDLEAFGKAMAQNNACQKALHAALISKRAEAIIKIARTHDARGWKVNGAGGDGGSLTLLGSGDAKKRRKMLDEINGMGKGIRSIPISLVSKGLEAWESDES